MRPNACNEIDGRLSRGIKKNQILFITFSLGVVVSLVLSGTMAATTERVSSEVYAVLPSAKHLQAMTAKGEVEMKEEIKVMTWKVVEKQMVALICNPNRVLTKLKMNLL
jgi:hypothetical protein